MVLGANFKEEYYNAMTNALNMVLDNEKYLALYHRYDALKGELNEILTFSGSFCTDVENCIDKATATIKSGAEQVLNTQELKDKVKVLLSVLEKLNVYNDKYGWNDDMLVHLQTVAAIGKYRDIENEIIKKYGWEQGQKIIYEVKKRAVEYEKSIGADFFRQNIEILHDVLRTITLYETDVVIKTSSASNKKSQEITLANADGELFKCIKSAQLNCLDATYFEIVLPIDLRCRKYNYYRLETTTNGRKFILEQEEEIIKELDRLYDSLPDEF